MSLTERTVIRMNDLIRKRDIDYISSPIAPVLKGEKVHYEYVAFRKQIEDISPVPAIPISVIEQIKAEIDNEDTDAAILHPAFHNGLMRALEIIDRHIKEFKE